VVYVDRAIWKYGRMLMCHMIADSEEELHQMADKLGIKRKWYQTHTNYRHYDISKGKREQAIKFGAKALTWREFIIKARELQELGVV